VSHQITAPEPPVAEELTADELASETALDLPERAALSIVDPGIFNTLPVAPLGQPAAEASGSGSDTPIDVGTT